MLRVTRRGRIGQVRDLSLDEDRALRRAFGCGAEEEARPAGAAVVRAHQHQRGGQWFLCDCLGDVAYPPVLVPVAELHIRRHVELPWPKHAAWCDFFRDPIEQRLVTTSYSRPIPGARLRLVNAYRKDDWTEARVTGHSVHRRRSSLATLLMTLIEAAKLNRIEARAPVIRLSEQYRALREAAREVELDEGIPLSSYLCTYPPALPQLMAKIARTEPARFERTRRPHGILVGMATGARAGHVEPFQGDPIPVSGEIAIFGEVDGHSERRPVSVDARPPYLIVCLVGRSAPNQPVGVLKAYLHPCAGPCNLMPVDSNLQRQTLALLLSLRDWLGKRRNVRVTIDKPVFDLGWSSAPSSDQTDGEGLSEADVLLARVEDAHRTSLTSLREIGIKHRPDGDEGARDPCVPDFILWADAEQRVQHEAVIVETMGFADDVYRDRKHRTHGLMSRILGGAPVVEHDFWFPAGVVQRQRDRQFWLKARWTLTGREPAASG